MGGTSTSGTVGKQGHLHWNLEDGSTPPVLLTNIQDQGAKQRRRELRGHVVEGRLQVGRLDVPDGDRRVLLQRRLRQHALQAALPKGLSRRRTLRRLLRRP